MRNLEQHIVHLIARHNCVIIPDFGAFLAHSVPAHYNIDDRTFMPPHRTLGFNPQVKVDDALLVSEYMSAHNLAYEAATAMLRNDILSLRRTLSRRGNVRFGELGTFSMNINSEITFEAAVNCIDDPENFGFEPLTIAQLHNIEERTITIKRRSIGKYIASIAAIILTFIFVTPISEQAFDNNIKASLGNFASSEQISMMQQLTSAAPQQVINTHECEISPIGFSNTKAAVSSAPTLVDTQSQYNEAQAINTPTIEYPSNSRPLEKQTENRPVHPLITPDIPQDSSPSPPLSEGTESTHAPQFHIIVASSPNADNAQLAIKELSSKLQREYKVVVCGKRHRIAAATYATEKEALENLSTFQATFPDAWILNH